MASKGEWGEGQKMGGKKRKKGNNKVKDGEERDVR